MRRILLLSLYSLIFIASVVAQPCTNLGQTPPTAFPVCGSNTFAQVSVPLCGGMGIPVNCNDGALYEDRNPYWYKFTCFISGTLGFVISPFTSADDYDWQLFDVTGRNPNDVFSDATLFVAANWSFMSGLTGAGPSGVNSTVCAADPNTFSRMPNIVAGRNYLLLVSHFTPSQSGYQLTFGGGTGSITDPNIPVIQSATPSCDGTRIVVRFSKPLKCNSLTANGSEFSITPAATISAAVGHGCMTGFSMDSATLTLSAPLAAGTYTLSATLGTDGNTLTDNCDLSIAVGNNVSFTINPQPALAMATVVAPNPCSPTSLVLNFPDPINCNSIAANGSDFLITGASTVAVTGAVATCNANGQTNSISLQLSPGLNASGNYQVQVQTGSDGNTLTGICNRQVPTGSTAAFMMQAQSPVAIGAVAQPGCSPSTLTLNFAEPILCASIAANGSDFTITGPSPVSISGASGTCNAAGETTTITLQLSAPVTTSGTYQLQVTTGTDGNTLLAPCLRQVNAGSDTSFTIPVAPASVIIAVDTPACNASGIQIRLDSPVQCSSIAANGSDFAITGPSTINISSASGTCNNGLTDIITIQLASPIVTGGSYQLQLQVGSDGNTLLNNCNRQSATATLNFPASDTVSAIFSYQLLSDCSSSDAGFIHPGGNGVNSWTWTINGNPVSTQPTFNQTFSAGTQPVIQLTVSNGLCSKSHSETLQLPEKVTVDFLSPDFTCPGDTVSIINRSTGTIDNWSWNFGNGQTSTSSQPGPQSYPLTGTETRYTISLIASNSNGCSDTVTRSILVKATCMIAVPSGFTPNNDGLNDYLYPINAFNAVDLDFKVFNRWGELVFSTNDWTRRWDGRLKGIPQATGVYAWTLRYKDKLSGVVHFMKGTTVLIR